MRTVDMIKRVKDDTGVIITRSRVFHYLRNDVFEDAEIVADNGYRDWSDEDYTRLLFAVLCSEVGMSTDVIRDAIKFRDFEMITKIVNHKSRLNSMLADMIISNS